MSCGREALDGAERMPEWMRRPLTAPGRSAEVEGLLGSLRLNTVCRSARCPNRGECYAAGTAAFLVLGDRCTRGCRFCAVDSATPEPVDPEEPARVAQAAARMGLGHVVVTMVTRDDLPDGGASHIVAVTQALRGALPSARVEVLTSDFGGDLASIDAVASAAPDVFDHNVETVPRLYGTVRPRADYARSLGVLARVRDVAPEVPTKSGLMVGLGESHEEVVAVLADLRVVGVGIVTIGQYLRPSAAHLPVARYVEPEVFDRYASVATDLGFAAVLSAPFVRSSYHAAEAADTAGAGGAAGGAGGVAGADPRSLAG